MSINTARLIIVLIGVTLPYLARLPFGVDWLKQYTDSGLGGWIFFGVLNAVAWGAILAISFKYKRSKPLAFPCLFGFGFLAWAHGTLDLSADAQAAIALVFIPIFALLPIAVGGVIGYFIDRRASQNELD